jgi:hypothetical protein
MNHTKLPVIIHKDPAPGVWRIPGMRCPWCDMRLHGFDHPRDAPEPSLFECTLCLGRIVLFVSDTGVPELVKYGRGPRAPRGSRS